MPPLSAFKLFLLFTHIDYACPEFLRTWQKRHCAAGGEVEPHWARLEWLYGVGLPHDVVHEIIVYDDGSTDGSGEEAAAQGAMILRGEVRRGVGHTIREGIRYGRANGFDVMVIMAATTRTTSTRSRVCSSRS